MDKLLIAACVVHAANNEYRRLIGEPLRPEFGELPDEQAESLMEAIANVGDTQPGESHERWCTARTAQGWVWGEEQDEEAKTHPNLVPFSELPEEQQFKDHLFLGIAKAFYPPPPAAKKEPPPPVEIPRGSSGGNHPRQT